MFPSVILIVAVVEYWWCNFVAGKKMTQKKHTPVSALVFVFCLSPGRVFDITSVQQPTLKSRISCSGHTYRKYAQDSFPLSALP